MNVKKRKKKTRFRGTHTHGRGFKKKARGKGHRGGVGRAGSGKRADHKKMMVVDGEKYFGRDKTRKAGKKIEVKTMTLRKILENLDILIKVGIGKENRGTYEINLKEYKIIGNIEIDKKLKIEAKSASRGATEAIKKSGGEIIIQN